MSVTSVDRDDDNLTITLIADFAAPIDQVWDLWSDPRKLERWLGPPTHPASVEKHDLTAGGEITFFMTGPEGDRSWGTWRVTAVDRPTSVEFTDAFADADGTPIADMPVSNDQGPAHRARRRHADGDACRLRIPRGHGEVGEHGHRRGPATGRRPNGRPASALRQLAEGVAALRFVVRGSNEPRGRALDRGSLRSWSGCYLIATIIESGPARCSR